MTDEQPRESDFGARSASGVFWLLLQSALARVFSVLSQIVLALVLAPSDFGRFALATAVVTIPNLLVSAGVLEFLVQRGRKLSVWSGPAFWVSVAAGCLGAGVIGLAAPIASSLYKTDLNGLFFFLGLTTLINSIAVVPTALLTSQLRFTILAAIASGEAILLPIATLACALLGCGAYSFVAPMPFVALARALALWRFAPARRLREPRLRRWATIFARSTPALGVRIVQNAVSQADTALLGVLVSEAAVGVYSFAFRFAVQPVNLFAANFQRVIFPALARLNDDPARQYQAALKASRLLAAITFPLCFLQALIAQPFLHAFFGDKWASAVPLIQIFSLGLAFDAANWVASALIQAQGEFRRDLVFTSAISLPFFLLIALGGVGGGATGVAVAVTIENIVFMPLYAWLVMRRGGLGLNDFAALFLKPALASGFAALVALLFAQWLPAPGAPDFFRIGWLVAIMPVTYLATLSRIDPEVARDLVERARGVWAKLSARLPRPRLSRAPR